MVIYHTGTTDGIFVGICHVIQASVLTNLQSDTFRARRVLFSVNFRRIEVKRDTFSWKLQLEKWEVGKMRSWKGLSWKVRHEIGKNEVEKFVLKLDNLGWSWKIPAEIGKWMMKFESLSNFAQFFPTSLGTFQIKHNLSNFRLSNLKFSNFSFFQLLFPTTRIPPKTSTETENEKNSHVPWIRL